MVSGFGSVRSWCERGVDRSVRRVVVGECVERVAWCGGVLFAGWSECAFRCSVCEGVCVFAVLLV